MNIRHASLGIFFSFQIALAGGLNTNTNQSVLFQRSLARDASVDVDAPYANPAGMAFMEDGLHLSLNNQTFWQSRSSEVKSPLLNGKKEYEGKAFVPSLPSVLATWHRGHFAVGGGFGVIGGGGRVSFDDGIPSFDMALASLPGQLSENGLETTRYSADISLEAESYIYGFMLGVSYQFFDMVSLSVGARFNYATNHYEGGLSNIKINPKMEALGLDGRMVKAAATFDKMSKQFSQMADQAESAGDKVTAAQYAAKSKAFAGYAESVADRNLELDQTGWGITPVFGLDVKYRRLTVATKFEYKTSIEMENETKKNEVGLPAYDDGVKDHNDIPSLVTVGLAYDILDNVRLSLGYHHWFDSDADYAGELEDHIDDTNEFLFGLEVDFLERWTLGGGIQVTKFGLSDEYLSDMNINLDSRSFGFGLSCQATKWMRVNLSYLHTLYHHYDEVVEYGKVTYRRDSRGFGAGLDFKL